jgi:hypothetical protein
VAEAGIEPCQLGPMIREYVINKKKLNEALRAIYCENVGSLARNGGQAPKKIVYYAA